MSVTNLKTRELEDFAKAKLHVIIKEILDEGKRLEVPRQTALRFIVVAGRTMAETGDVLRTIESAADIIDILEGSQKKSSSDN